MRTTLTALAAAATIATLAAPTTADARHGWRGSGIGGYYNYYQSAPVYYDYYAPALVYYDYVAPQPYYGCWRLRYGYRYRVC
jgi:hypothetical protein